MHDIRAIRADPATFDAALARRGLAPVAKAVIETDAKRRKALEQLEGIQALRKRVSRAVSNARQGEPRLTIQFPTDSPGPETGSDLRTKMAEKAGEVVRLQDVLRELLETLPNTLDPDVPDGRDETANVTVKQVGEPRRPNFPAREHFDLGEALNQMLFEPAARMAGSRFTILQGALARMERALGQFMLDLHVEKHGYTETQVPLLVNTASAYGTDKLPKFADDLFKVADRDMWLIPTAEVPLTSMVMDQIVPEAALPIRMTALSECFRSEAGSAGRDTRGMLRQHQFRKVEMVSITHPDASAAELERMTGCAEAVLEALGLAYRRMLLCAGDTGFGAAKTYDLEVWLPGQGAWREISSCSNTRGFQARRMNTRMRGTDGKIAGPVHTLNGSGLAVGRTLIAVMETYQEADGAIAVPDALRPYMAGLERIPSPSPLGRGPG